MTHVRPPGPGILSDAERAAPTTLETTPKAFAAEHLGTFGWTPGKHD